MCGPMGYGAPSASAISLEQCLLIRWAETWSSSSTTTARPGMSFRTIRGRHAERCRCRWIGRGRRLSRAIGMDEVLLARAMPVAEASRVCRRSTASRFTDLRPQSEAVSSASRSATCIRMISPRFWMATVSAFVPAITVHQPLMRRLDVSATARASFYVYNDRGHRRADRRCDEGEGDIRSCCRLSAGAIGALYQEMILDHYRRPRNKGEISNAGCVGSDEESALWRRDRAFTCGLTATDRRSPVFRRGCSISQASASMMTQLVKGKSRRRGRRDQDAFPRYGDGG